MPLNDVQVAVKAAEAGAAIVLALSGQDLEHIGKGHNDFAKQAGIDSEKVILEIIRQQRPDDVVIGEESGTHQPLRRDLGSIESGSSIRFAAPSTMQLTLVMSLSTSRYKKARAMMLHLLLPTRSWLKCSVQAEPTPSSVATE